jgi:quinol monooxygenase YgiN
MNAKHFLTLGASMVVSSLCGHATAQKVQEQYVQIAEIEIDPAHLEDYKAAVREHIEAAIRLEPGVLILYAVSDKDNPAHVKVFEVYESTDAYKAHLE